MSFHPRFIIDVMYPAATSAYLTTYVAGLQKLLP